MSLNIPSDRIESNLEQLFDHLLGKGLDGMYLSSFDTYFSEYVPREECHRYYFTGFTGSVAEVYIDAERRSAHLFVDGRYHAQAKNESSQIKGVTVEYLDMSTPLLEGLFNLVKKLSPKTIGVEGSRTPFSTGEVLNKMSEVQLLDEQEVSKIGEYISYVPKNEIVQLSEELTGESSQEKAKRVVTSDEAYFINSLDSLTWLTNFRGYQAPNLSVFFGKGIVTQNKIFLMVKTPELLEKSIIENTFFKVLKEDELEIAINLAQSEAGAKSFIYEEQTMSLKDYSTFKSLVGIESLKISETPFVNFHADKNPTELKVMRESFVSASKAIAETIRWCKKSVLSGEKVTERSLANKLEENYFKGGAVGLSFNTICGVESNGAIIHYGNASDEVVIKVGDKILLDSGVYYQGGLATDTTRSFVIGENTDKNYQENYTLVLQGLIDASMAKVEKGTEGKVVDAMSRGPLNSKNKDYAHGTGHGVGVNVHEGGFSLRPESVIPLVEHRVGSIEPGYYVTGEYGIRLENIVETIKTNEGKIGFSPLTWVTFEDDLVDFELLNDAQKTWYKDYQAVCRDLGTSTTAI